MLDFRRRGRFLLHARQKGHQEAQPRGPRAETALGGLWSQSPRDRPSWESCELRVSPQPPSPVTTVTAVGQRTLPECCPPTGHRALLPTCRRGFLGGGGPGERMNDACAYKARCPLGQTRFTSASVTACEGARPSMAPELHLGDLPVRFPRAQSELRSEVAGEALPAISSCPRKTRFCPRATKANQTGSFRVSPLCRL